MKPSGIGEAMLVVAGVILATLILLGLTAATCLGWLDYSCKRFIDVSFLWILAIVIGGIYVVLDGNERGTHRH